MKIVVLTVYDAPNYGSFLQAYATKKFFEKMGHEVYFVHYRSFIDTIRLFFVNKKNSLKHLPFTLKRMCVFRKNQKKHFSIINIKKSLKIYDKCIIGSDELWNVRNDKYFKKDIFYGTNYNTNDVLVYAISISEAQNEDFSSNILKNIKRLKNVTYRDENTKEFLDYVGINAEFACDPTFLIKTDDFNFNTSEATYLPNDYILVYTYGMNKEQQNSVVNFAKQNNLKTVSVGNYNGWCDYNFICDIGEFSKIFSEAKYVVTTTFHGTIFSILNKKKFIVIKNTPKITDLLCRYNVKNRLLIKADDEAFSRILMEEIDYNKVTKIIDDNRIKSEKIIRGFFNENM